MFNFFKSKKKSLENTSENDPLIEFIAEYNSSLQKNMYAVHLWGIVEAFNKIFGDLGNYHKSDQSRKAQYISMIGEDAIKQIKARELIQASCNRFFINYLVATKGVDRATLRGSIEQVADILDGIVRNGALEMRKSGQLAAKAQEFISEKAAFRIGSAVIKGPVTERAVVDLSTSVSLDLQKILHTREDYYWFVIEQYDRLFEKKTAIRSLLDNIALFPIEHEGRRSEQSYVGKPNPGVMYMTEISSAVRAWCAATSPTFNPDELSLRIIAAIYGHFRLEHKTAIDVIRLEHASHFHNNCIASGSFQSAQRWSEVINAVA